MAKRFTGKTEDADAPFLGAEYWQEGKTVSGKVAHIFQSNNGPCYVLSPVDGAQIDGDTLESCTIGNLTGFNMALRAAGLDKLLVGDMVSLECTGLHQTGKGNARPNFQVEVIRP